MTPHKFRQTQETRDTWWKCIRCNAYIMSSKKPIPRFDELGQEFMASYGYTRDKSKWGSKPKIPHQHAGKSWSISEISADCDVEMCKQIMTE